MNTNSMHPAFAMLLASMSFALAYETPHRDPNPLTKPKDRLAINLVDGSHIIGESDISSVRLHTPYAKMDIALNQILNLNIQRERGTALFKMRNGDILTGVVDLPPITLSTAFGNVSIGSQYITFAKVLPPKRLPGAAGLRFPISSSEAHTTKPYPKFAVADFDHDGLMDVAVSDTAKNAWCVDVYLNDGMGALKLKERYPIGNYPQHIVAGDFDEDGHLDLVVAAYFGSLGDGTMHLLKGNGDGAFTTGPGFSAKVGERGQNPIRMAVADLNNDSHLDLVVEMNNDWALNVHWGKGDGTFTPKFSLPNGQNPGNTEIADLNHDGWLDLVAGSLYTCLYVHLSDGKGGYLPPTPYLNGTSRRQPIILGDLNHDDHIDVLVANSAANYVSVMMNDGKGGLTEKTQVKFQGEVGLAKVTDFNSDGNMDFVLSSGKQVLVTPSNADGTFKDPIPYDMGHTVAALQLHDLDDDGHLDFVYIDADSNRVIMRSGLFPNHTDG